MGIENILSTIAIVFSFIAIIVAGFTAWYAREQVKVGKRTLDESIRSGEAQNFISLIDHLQREDVRKARALVLGELATTDYKSWTIDQKRTASLVPSSYEVAGILVRNRLVIEEAFIGSYGPSIIRCYEVCLPLLQEYRQQMSTGTRYTYMENFEWLYRVAKAAPMPAAAVDKSP